MIKTLKLSKIMRLLIIGLLIMTNSLVSFSQWELAIDKDSIKVYNKPNDNGYSFYKAEGYLNASINEVYNTFTTIEDHPLWISNCAETRVINKIPDVEIMYMSLYDFPWPSTDRYSVSHLKVISKDTAHIHMKSGPAKNHNISLEDAVYVSRFYEEVEIIYLAENKTKIKLSGAYDPAGAIPAWITDMFMKQSPYESILAMRALLNKKEAKH